MQLLTIQTKSFFIHKSYKVYNNTCCDTNIKLKGYKNFVCIPPVALKHKTVRVL